MLGEAERAGRDRVRLTGAGSKSTGFAFFSGMLAISKQKHVTSGFKIKRVAAEGRETAVKATHGET